MVDAESRYSVEIERRLFTQLRELEVKSYAILIQKRVLSGKPEAYLKRDLRRVLVSRYLETHKDLELEALAKQIIAVRDRIIHYNVGWVGKRARVFHSNFLDFNDRVQEGIFGLVRAINRFDIDRGFRFVTYAQYWIDCSIRLAVRRLSTTVRPPREPRVKTPPVTMAELVEDTLLEYAVDQGDHALLDWDKVQKIVKSLPIRDQLILKQRFGNDEDDTLEAIGQKWGVSRERIRQCQNLSLDVIRERLGVLHENI